MPHTSHVTYEEVKTREAKFNPLLQTFKSKDDERKADSIQDLNRVKSLMNHIVISFVTFRIMCKNIKKTMTLLISMKTKVQRQLKNHSTKS